MINQEGCIIPIVTLEIDNAKDIDIVMPMYNLMEYSDNYCKISGILWQYCRNEPNDNLTDSKLLESKIKITGNTTKDGNKKDIEITVPLKYLSNIWRTLEMPSLINCEINLILTWSSTCVIINSTVAGRFAINETKLHVPVVTLSTQHNAKLLQQLRPGFKRTINWNKCQSDPKTYTQKKITFCIIILN